MFLQRDSLPNQAELALSNPRSRSFHRSFLLHIRPRSYHADSIAFSNTCYLGFLSVFFLVFECVTGLILMVYYVPTPAEAYGSIVRLTTEVPFGSLIRDLHRLGGECMVVVVVLHLVRVFVADAYKGIRGITWITGVLLLLCTLALAFSGYLLPWDQLSFWAVTIGTSLADTIPSIGSTVTLLLRGGPQFGADGLLRFYLLHILGIPTLMLVLVGIHYYRISRLHGISLPVSRKTENGGNHGRTSRNPLFPTVFVSELIGSLLLLGVLIAAAAFAYDAPLESHADPRHTPARTRAPWFFLWLQGALKLGDSFIMGICLPLGIVIFLLVLPYIGRKERRRLRKRPWALGGLAAFGACIIIGSVLGLPEYGVRGHPVTALLQDIAPEEEPSRFHLVGYEALPVGLYGSEMQPQAADNAGDFDRLLRKFYEDLASIAGEHNLRNPQPLVIVEEWQAELKRVTIRVNWRDPAGGERSHSAEQIIFIHKNKMLQPYQVRRNE